MIPKTRKILVIDDNQAVHQDYRKVLEDKRDERDLNEMESILFGETSASPVQQCSFKIDSAYQGEEGLGLVRDSVAAEDPYSLAFIDMRMPPGWGGIKTTQEIWKVDCNLPVVICTAYTDHTWEEFVAELPRTEQLLILKKPFDNIELKQMAASQSALRELIELANLARQNACNS